jgi:hypothetical protein
VALGFQAHAAAIYLAIQLATALAYIIFVEKSFGKISKKLAIGIGIFVLSFTPLILFDIRHDFLNTKLLLGFLNSNTAKQGIDFTRALIIYIRNPNLLTFFHNREIQAGMNIILIVITLFAGHHYMNKDKYSTKMQLINIYSWILIPLVTLSLYKGTISEYYFVTVTSLLILFAGYFCALLAEKKQSGLLVAGVLTLLAVGNLYPVLQRDDPTSLYYKKALVKYMANQKDPYFSLSYNVPLGRGYGFAYLLRYNGIQPDDTKPTPKYFLRIEPEQEENGLPEQKFGAYMLSKRVE